MRCRIKNTILKLIYYLALIIYLKTTKMKKVNLFLYLLLTTTLVGFGSCNDDEDLTRLSPERAILGEWKEIATGTTDENMKSIEVGYFLRFLPDKTLMVKSDPLIEDRSYRMDSEHIYIDYYYSINDTIYCDEHTYKYNFSKNKLRLEYKDGPIPWLLGYPTIYLYKKIEDID